MMPFHNKNTLRIPTIGKLRSRGLNGEHLYFEAFATAHVILHGGNVYLVTANHVIEEVKKSNQGTAAVKSDSVVGSPSRVWPIPDNFVTDEALDVAISHFPSYSAYPDGVMAIQEAAVLTADQSIEMDIAEGTQIYTVGYPILPKFPGHKELPIDGSNGPPTYPTMKHGYVARIADWKNGDANIITIDCDIFPGNSGGLRWTRSVGQN